MAARAAIRDAGRALGVPLPDVDRIAKLIPSGPGGFSIEEAVDQIPELKTIYATQPEIRKLLDTAKEIEGLARNAGTHAAGVVISAGPLIDYTPLVRFGDGGVNTQYDMDWIERIGLLKMDFLGLRNLTVMENAVREIRRTVDPEFDLSLIPYDDARTYEMLARGETMGVFQLESEGMKRVCAELQPSRFEDIVALVALYRPGPMELDTAVHRQQARPREAAVPAPEARTDPRRRRYGIPIYQEQVMQMARDIAGFTMGEADELRKVMGKKQKEKIPIYQEKFVEGAIATCAHGPRAGGAALSLHRAVRRIRLQQVARRRVCVDRLSDGVPQGEPSAAVSGRADDVGEGQDRQARRVHRRGEEARHRGASARRQRVAHRFRRRRRALFASAWRRSRASARRRSAASSRRAARRRVRRSLRPRAARRREARSTAGSSRR